MKLKKEYLFLLLAIAGLGTYLATRSNDQTHFELPQPEKVEAAKIDRLVLNKGEKSIELRKKDEKWFVGPKSYPADSVKVKNMVKTAADLSLTALVSESGNYERYGLTPELKMSVQAYAGKEAQRNFSIGRQAPTNQHTFVTLAQDPKVYHARGTFDATFDHTIDELRDETVMAYERDEITSLSLIKGDHTIVFNRKEIAIPSATPSDEKQNESDDQPPETEMQWVDGSGNEADKASIDRLISTFAKFRCDDYLEDEAKAELETPLWTVVLKTAQTEHTLSLFEMENKKDREEYEYGASSSGSPYPFIIHKSRIDKIEKDMNKLLDSNDKA